MLLPRPVPLLQALTGCFGLVPQEAGDAKAASPEVCTFGKTTLNATDQYSSSCRCKDAAQANAALGVFVLPCPSVKSSDRSNTQVALAIYHDIQSETTSLTRRAEGAST